MKKVDKIVLCIACAACWLMFLYVSIMYTEHQTRNFAISMVLYGLATIVSSFFLWRTIRKAAIGAVHKKFNEQPNIKDDIDLL